VNFKAEYLGPMGPLHPCREMPTRHCPAVYDDVCGERPCARFEAELDEPWRAEARSFECGRSDRTVP
jgi:hypothetical protein